MPWYVESISTFLDLEKPSIISWHSLHINSKKLAKSYFFSSIYFIEIDWLQVPQRENYPIIYAKTTLSYLILFYIISYYIIYYIIYIILSSSWLLLLLSPFELIFKNFFLLSCLWLIVLRQNRTIKYTDSVSFVMIIHVTKSRRFQTVFI